jgi:hypothetical protein
MERVKVTRSARKHRIGVAHIVAALENAGDPVVDGGDRRMYIGTDDRGVELEIVMVNDGRDGVWAIIHAMPISFRARRGGDD